jgi:hypothetical protein
MLGIFSGIALLMAARHDECSQQRDKSLAVEAALKQSRSEMLWVFDFDHAKRRSTRVAP